MATEARGNGAALRIAIIGSGFSGIGMAIRLRRMGIDSFTLYEAAESLGGTWRDNAYPGAACDIPSHLYSFSFELNPAWTRTYAPQQEILDYLRHCARKYDVERFIEYRSRVRAARFVEARRVWQVEIERGQADGAINTIDIIEADIVIAAHGPLSRPSLPHIPGIERFEGKVFHSARWDHDYALEGKRIAVIGTGASAIQFVPQVQPHVARLAVFQRTPPWIMPRRDRAISARWRWVFRHVPLAQRAARAAIYWQLESRALGFSVEPRLLKTPTKFARSYLAHKVKDPELRARLTPDYLLGCKRVLLSSDYYPALAQPNVELVTEAIREVVADGIVTADGTHRAFDAIVCGTGFLVNDVEAPFQVTGTGGRDLGETWRRDGPEAYLGASVAGFPNLFFMIGPNTALGHNSMIYMIESHIGYIACCIRALQRSGARTMDVRAEAQRAWNMRLQARFARTVWQSGCHSYYLTQAGKNTALWPGFTFMFRRKTRRVRRADYAFGR
ncbi:cation diffusion facilitator CzcD-associated flavoprotein CzcO [Paraburkholderia unamae]|uniref:flavin-containing monooxygenase n=1 Tax=Paraburkholderia unamae TaxID=219649 RepID=UPI000DC30FC8|nr:NAD(P)/FAD-dependent oxidoreductase [Paraburkholderia unamae]RAR59947.1 cation diffusion facilitator CzcD-associated flavoprotein CzcO [Paraburkholderia unamae]